MLTLKRFCILMFFCTLTACSTGATKYPAGTPSATPFLPGEATQVLTVLPPTATAVPMAITVNADGISVEEFDAELSRYKTAQKALGVVVSDDQTLQTVREDLVSQLLLAQGAIEAGFSLDEAALQQRKATLAAKVGADKFSAWLQEHSYTETGFELALKRSISAAWMRDKIMASVASTSEQVHVRQILLYNEDVAKKYYDQLLAGANFDELAAQVDPVTRGDIGWFPRGYLNEKAVEDAAFALETGATSAIIPGEAGFHILKLLDRQSERELSPDTLFSIQNGTLNDWLTTRRQQSKIVMVP